jgi:hypothetical protein
MRRKRDADLAPGPRSFPAEGYVIIHCIEKDDVVAILHVVPGTDVRTAITLPELSFPWVRRFGIGW